MSDNRFGLVVLPVGMGKSWVMVGIAEYFQRVVVLQPCLELVKQNHSKLADAGLSTTMVDSVHGKKNLNAEFIYTTPQSLVHMLDKIQEPDLLIIDEAEQFWDGTMYNTIFKHWKTCRVAGFTATPYHYRRKTVYTGGWMCQDTYIDSIEEQYGPAVINISRAEGHKLGFSPTINMQKIRIAPITAEHIEGGWLYKELVNKHLFELKALLGTLSNAIIYCDSISHAELISESLNIPMVLGKTPKKQRVDIVSRFNDNQTPFVATVGCLVRGFDKPDLQNVILLSNFNNACELEQVVGRLNRGSPDAVKTCWYNRHINQKPPVVGYEGRVRIKHL